MGFLSIQGFLSFQKGKKQYRKNFLPGKKTKSLQKVWRHKYIYNKEIYILYILITLFVYTPLSLFISVCLRDTPDKKYKKSKCFPKAGSPSIYLASKLVP